MIVGLQSIQNTSNTVFSGQKKDVNNKLPSS